MPRICLLIRILGRRVFFLFPFCFSFCSSQSMYILSSQALSISSHLFFTSFFLVLFLSFSRNSILFWVARCSASPP